MSKSRPLPKVSAAKYKPRPAKVRVRLKGSNEEGDLYEGQNLIKRCKGCRK